MQGRFVAFSKRINSVLVPRNFLEWANTRFAEEAEQEYFFVWQGDEIVSPPVSLAQLKKMSAMPGNQVQVSAVATPAKKCPLWICLNINLPPRGLPGCWSSLANRQPKNFGQAWKNWM